MQKEFKLKEIPTNYFMASMWAMFFILLFALLGANFYAQMSVRNVCGEALRGDVFEMCSTGCAEIKERLDPKLFSGDQEWGLGCEVPADVLKRWESPGAVAIALPPLDIKESYMKNETQNSGT